MKNSPSPSPSHDAIAERAHTIWIQAGRPEGQELEHWLQAENELQTERRHAEEPEPQRSTAVAAPGSASENEPGAGGRAGSATPFRRASQRTGGDSRKSNGR